VKRILQFAVIGLAIMAFGCKTSTQVSEETLAAAKPEAEEASFMKTAVPDSGIGGIGASRQPQGSSIMEAPDKVASAFPAGLAPEVRHLRHGYYNEPATDYVSPGSSN